MSEIVSHAQYGEDLILWGALSDIENGFYIDVGAMHPTNESVTKLFYDRGWSGINIEPRPSAWELIKDARPRDINLQLAASNSTATIVIHEIDGHPGLSTSIDQIVRDYTSKGLTHRSFQVNCTPLSEICNMHVRQDIHFLKIDVEGAEKSVLESCDFTRFRPWLLAIEATIPCTYIPCHEEWEKIVLDAGYEFALFNQINRYYVAREHADRKIRIVAPI